LSRPAADGILFAPLSSKEAEPTSLAANLAQLVREARWVELEAAWTEHALGSAALGPALEAVNAAAARREIQRCLPLVREHAEVLGGAGRSAEAAELLGTTMLLGGSPGELTRPLLLQAEQAFAGQAFWEIYREIAGLREGAPDPRAAWRAFRKLLALEPGRVLYHAAGWGLGRVDAVELVAREVAVRFLTGRSDRFPLQTTIEIFEVLESSDLRCLVVRDPAALDRLLKEEPLEVLRWVLLRNDGRASQAAIKLAMGTLGVDGSRFTSWWKRAQKQAEGSEWFELSGPPNRALVRMLDRAEDPSAGLRRQLLRSRDLGEALARVRALFTGGASVEGVRATALEALEELAAQRGELAQRLAAWLFLREQRGATPELLRAVLETARSAPPPADRSQPSALWTLFQTIPGVREQERGLELLQECLGEAWLAEAEQSLVHAPPGMVRGLVDALEAAGRSEALAQHYSALLARPTRNPVLLVRLAERIETGPMAERLAPGAQRAQCLLQLAVHLHGVTSANPTLSRARARLVALLTEGEPPLLRRLLADSDLETLRGFASLLENGVDRAIDRLFTQVAVGLSPDVFKVEERAFWDSQQIWVTRAGMHRLQEELRLLRDVKIPENAEAIGRAASYGDLSENAEWSAAIEEQRNLTNRAMELEGELANARLIENALLPEGLVAPGTHVRYRDLESGSEHEIDVLGPWDADGERRVSYRSPLAAGMLGRRAGDEALLSLPSGRVAVRILSVAPIAL
jgi:transcription elongation factor GreA